ncbi:hypothetical protein KCP70_17780 [Salmonella enterica subsp. enterica]|nr:hypothetical protein KCP70_17780 [Salmonella enterica subsp. enterica]
MAHSRQLATSRGDNYRRKDWARLAPGTPPRGLDGWPLYQRYLCAYSCRWRGRSYKWPVQWLIALLRHSPAFRYLLTASITLRRYPYDAQRCRTGWRSKIVPHAGAIARVNFATISGKAVLIREDADGGIRQWALMFSTVKAQTSAWSARGR